MHHNTRSVSHLGIMWANDTQSVFFMSRRLLNSGLVAVTAENFTQMRWRKGQQLCLSVLFYVFNMPSDGSSPQRHLWHVNKTSLQMSLLAGRISSSPIVNGFLGLAIRLASKYDRFCSSCSCFFPSKSSEGLFLMQSAWSPCGEAVLESWSLRIMQRGLWWMITCRDKSIFEVDLVCELPLSFS